MTRYTEARLREYMRELHRCIAADNVVGSHFAEGVRTAIDVLDNRQVIAPEDVAAMTETLLTYTRIGDEREAEEVLPDVEERTCDPGRDTEEQQTEE